MPDRFPGTAASVFFGPRLTELDPEVTDGERVLDLQPSEQIMKSHWNHPFRRRIRRNRAAKEERLLILDSLLSEQM
jgi:hypothetical protein